MSLKCDKCFNGTLRGRTRPNNAACVTEDAKVLSNVCLQSALAFRQRRLNQQTDSSGFSSGKSSEAAERTNDGSAASDQYDL